MAKRKRVEAWALMNVGTDGSHYMLDVQETKDLINQTEADYARESGGERYIVHLTEHDPAAEAVVRAAVKHYEENGSRTHSNDCAVCLAVERYQKKAKR